MSRRKCGHFSQRHPAVGLLPCATCSSKKVIKKDGFLFYLSPFQVRLRVYPDVIPPDHFFNVEREDYGMEMTGQIWCVRKDA